MNDHRPRLVRGAGVVALLIALTALLSSAGQLTRMPVTPGLSGPIGAAPPITRHGSAGRPTRPAPPRPTQTALPHSVPVRVSIPAINAASSLMPLALNPDRTVQVPPLSNPMQAGWYSLGPTPGEVGASVILGHVDGDSEPGIFYRLREVQAGDQVLVTRQDGTVARFEVYRTEQVPKEDFPSEQVYGATTRPELRLITCGGVFDRGSGNYLDNVIVFATLVQAS